ncbi:MAG: exosortase H [candidate division Zixibacteria bacterium 4484_95]|nr:MAG: exosortase H [candidate division Zixibacteria bacterium 4484_95]
MGTLKIKIKKPVMKSLIRLYLSFGVIMIFFIIVFNTKIFYWNVNVPFTSFIAFVSGLVINIFGGSSHVTGTHLSTAHFSINVVDGCNGLYAAAILISGVIAYPSSIAHKLLGVLIGFSAIFVLNLVRVISLLYLGQYYPDIFHEAHIFIWQPIIILWAIFIWYIWWSIIEGEKNK